MMKFCDTLTEALQRPPLYKRSSAPFWEDEHISAQMLKAHLDPESDGASRNADFIDRSAQWIDSLFYGKGAELLDLGCGPGLYAERFFRCGYRVTGMDISGRSIDHAKRSAAEQKLSVRYLCQNYLTAEFENQAFGFAVMIYCDYGALTPQERQIVLKKVFSCLKNGGKFLLDVFSPTFFAGFVEGQTWKVCPHDGFWNGSPHVLLQSRYRYPSRVTLERSIVLTETKHYEYNIWNTCFSREELIDEVRGAGFSVCGTWSDVAGTPYADDSPTMALLLEKRS